VRCAGLGPPRGSAQSSSSLSRRYAWEHEARRWTSPRNSGSSSRSSTSSSISSARSSKRLHIDVQGGRRHRRRGAASRRRCRGRIGLAPLSGASERVSGVSGRDLDRQISLLTPSRWPSRSSSGRSGQRAGGRGECQQRLVTTIRVSLTLPAWVHGRLAQQGRRFTATPRSPEAVAAAGSASTIELADDEAPTHLVARASNATRPVARPNNAELAGRGVPSATGNHMLVDVVQIRSEVGSASSGVFAQGGSNVDEPEQRRSKLGAAGDQRHRPVRRRCALPHGSTAAARRADGPSARISGSRSRVAGEAVKEKERVRHNFTVRPLPLAHANGRS